MPAIVTRLRIAGFKSFAEPTTIEILPGMTGIVGPNGCGKSNVVEALRWAMGETSARSLRGGDMEEVIFAGSAARPSRNIAEVIVTLDEARGLAPAPLQGEHELQVSRQIERGAGSTYRVNGREMRARDVQTIFADIASGARSSAMVSQGRVAFLVDARPEDRRSVLEEAAGITGLHARRNEAEIRLRAAETNLARVGDLRDSLEVQHAALTSQAEAARAYRQAVDDLTRGERELLSIQLGRAVRAGGEAARALSRGHADLVATECAAIEAEAAEAAANAEMSESSGTAALASSLLERARAALEALENEGARAASELARARDRLAEVESDHALAAKQAADAETDVTRLMLEETEQRAFLASYGERLGEAKEERDQAGAETRREGDLSAARHRAAGDFSTLSAAAIAAASRVAMLDGALRNALALAPSEAALLDAASAVATAEASLQDTRQALVSAEAARRTAENDLDRAVRESGAASELAARAMARAASTEARLARLTAEHRTLDERRRAVLGARIASGSVERANNAADAARQAFEAAADAVDEAERGRRAADAALAQARSAADGARTRARARGAAVAQAQRERERLEPLHKVLHASLDQARGELVDEGALRSARDVAAGTAASIEAARSDAAAAERTRDEAERQIAAAGIAIAAREAESLAARVEIDALTGVADEAIDDVMSVVAVPEKLERAAAAGLGEALTASLDPAGTRFWQAPFPLDDRQPLPDGTTPLDRLLQAPPHLERALSQIGLLAAEADGSSLQRALRPGQSLVSLEGALFRWDGYTARDGQPSPVAERLRARRRREACRALLADAESALPALRQELAAVRDRGVTAVEALQAARAAIGLHERALSAAMAAEATLAARDAKLRARVEALAAERTRFATALAEAVEREAIARNDAGNSDAEGFGKAEQDAAIEAEAAAKAERRALDARRDAEAMQMEMEAEARRLAAREEETLSLLAALDPAIARLGEDCAAAEVDIKEARTTADAGARAVEASAADLRAAEAASEQAQRRETACRERCDWDAAVLEKAQTTHASLLAQSREAEQRRSLLEPERRTARVESAEIDARLEAARRDWAALGPDTGALELCRQRESEASRAVAMLEAEAVQVQQRLTAIAREAPAALSRREAADARNEALAQRLRDTRAALAAIEGVPATIAAKSEAAADALQAAEQDSAVASGRALNAQAALIRHRDARRAADAAAAAAREAILRAEAAQAQSTALSADIAERIKDAGGGIEPASDPTAAIESEARRRVSRLLKARDEIGPVNLLAEREADEIGQRLAALTGEARELEEAIARLRGSIGHLNREGRERLSASFVQIDAQFRALFGRMFDGGRAHLALVGSDDPLEAGLEIYAQPPGKKLSTLSLLSGGEQALTALSLIFAAFRCNPAPVCVLDEVDAPLDDANVERFCRLVSDMAKETGTRFLVVTHHQLTMASMDRLYGVTMQERGVSRLLSVDLGRAVELSTS